MSYGKVVDALLDHAERVRHERDRQLDFAANDLAQEVASVVAEADETSEIAEGDTAGADAYAAHLKRHLVDRWKV